jgi:hypothetical protein
LDFINAPIEQVTITTAVECIMAGAPQKKHVVAGLAAKNIGSRPADEPVDFPTSIGDGIAKRMVCETVSSGTSGELPCWRNSVM